MSRTTSSRPARRARTTLAAGLALVAALAVGSCQTPRDDDGGQASAGRPGAGEPTPGPDEPTSSDGATAPSPTPTDPTSAAPVAADLTVSVDATGEGAVATFTLTCEPVGGDHPDAAAACAALAAAGGTTAFEPTPPGTSCTEQWGGPQTATVDGTVDGQEVHARFDRHDGCEISRWDRLAPLFGPDAGLL